MTELEFVQRCVKGDKQAWDEFVTRYSRLIYCYIHSILKIKGINLSSLDNINDLFQEIFVLLSKDNFKKLSMFKARNGCSLASWLRQVVINYTLNYVHRTKSVVSLDEELNDDGFSLKDILADNSLDCRSRIMAEERLEYLTGCIKELDLDDKYFLELYLNRGIELSRLKAVLKVSRGAVDMRRSRIIGRLRECFKRKGFELDY
ncbi:MAG: sigma-70 family RNA polymerase sigma factor [Candidatus Omnitrophota bacterium]